jgi:hypothetical protein
LDEETSLKFSLKEVYQTPPDSRSFLMASIRARILIVGQCFAGRTERQRVPAVQRSGNKPELDPLGPAYIHLETTPPHPTTPDGAEVH